MPPALLFPPQDHFGNSGSFMVPYKFKILGLFALVPLKKTQ